MKPLTLKVLNRSIIFALCSSAVSLSHAELMFSKYVDGSSNRKGLEIYNPDNRTVTLSDYKILQYSNGATTPSATFTLNNVQLGPQQRYVVGRTELQTEIGSKVNQVANLAYNGDDALVLTYLNTPVDRFGRVGERPTLGWGNNPYTIANSFTRIEQTNNVASIDPATAFNLEVSWTRLADRNDFSVLGSGGGTTTPPVTVACSDTATPIATLQDATLNQAYTVRGIITADFRYTNGFNGFYIQTADNNAVANKSNAIFVYTPAGSGITGGVEGDEVILRGTLQTFSGQRQIASLTANVLTCGTGTNLIAAKPLQLPFASLTALTANSPALYNGMLVTFPQKLTVSENYNYGRYGELALSNSRLFIPTQLHIPGSTDARNLAANNLLNKVILDDGYNNQNRTPMIPSGFNAYNTLRSGYSVENVTGVLEYRFNQWRVQPLVSKPLPTFSSVDNPRAGAPARTTGSNLRIAAFNVLNYDNGLSQGFPTERGALSKAEFDKQHAKIVSAMQQINADVFGLMEIANNGYDAGSAIDYLTKGLGAGWTYVKPQTGNRLGTDAIAVGIIYNANKVQPVGTPAVLDLGVRNRTVIAQSFKVKGGSTIFTVVPNHLKSKSCSTPTASDVGGALNEDQADGQACWAPTRVDGIQRITAWLATNPTGVTTNKVMILGDFNSYAKEDAIRTLEQQQYTNLLADSKVGKGLNAYSYVFGVASDVNGYGGAGTLDYGFASKTLLPLVKKAQVWNINADEPTVLSYSEEFKSAQQITDFYANDPYRSSDHDPVIVDLSIDNKQPPQNPLQAIVNLISSLINSLLNLFK